MTNAIPRKMSLIGETVAALKKTASETWPWVLIFGMFFSGLLIYWTQLSAKIPVLQFLAAHPELSGHQELLQQNPELAQQYMDALTGSLKALLVYCPLWLTILMLVEALAVYIFSVIQLNLTAAAALNYNGSDFFYWLGKICWKYTRPILWCLIPLIGPLFYIRSTVRYTAVTPMALLRKGDELKNSWDLTDGNWWRIFGGQIAVTLGMMLVVMLASFVISFIVVAITHGQKTFAFQAFIVVLQGWAMGLGTLIVAAYSCTVYKVLKAEKG